MDPSHSTQQDFRQLPLDDGGTLAWRERGSGRPVLLLHGWGVSGPAFGPLVDALAAAHRVIVPDLRGHGASSAFEDGHRCSRLADDVHALVTALELDAVGLVGWSMGALVAWDYCDRHAAADLAGVVSIDMVPRLLSTADWPHGLRRGDGPEVFARSVAAMRADWRAFMDVFIPRIFAAPPPADDPRLALLYAAAGGNDGAVMARVWTAMAGIDLRDALPRIAAPALHLHGERSRLYRPEAARWVAGALTGSPVAARLLGFAGSGHAPHLEQPVTCARAIVRFFREAAAEAARASRTAGTGRNPN